ncbi:MAG: PorT family protein [Bacteroidales bacterium]|jgi:hypothetical protein|nr:PorT family protein [Bacteroidales bacterium]
MRYKYIMSKKKYLLSLFAVFIMAIPSAEAQLFQGMVSSGINLSQVEGDEVSGFYHLGFTGGIGVMMPLQPSKLTGRWRASMELLYSRRGAYEKKGVGVKAPFGYSLTLQYVDIPVMIHYKDPKLDLMFGLGLQYGRLFKVNEQWRLPESPGGDWVRPLDTANVPSFNRNELSIVADVRFGIWKRLKCSIRWQYGLTASRKGMTYSNSKAPGTTAFYQWNNDYKNHWLTLRLVYVINERSTKLKDRNINRNQY